MTPAEIVALAAGGPLLTFYLYLRRWLPEVGIDDNSPGVGEVVLGAFLVALVWPLSLAYLAASRPTGAERRARDARLLADRSRHLDEALDR